MDLFSHQSFVKFALSLNPEALVSINYFAINYITITLPNYANQG